MNDLERQHAHDLSGPTRGGEQSRLLLALGVALVAMVAEALGGWFSNSLALLSDAGHMLADAGAIGLSFFALRIGARPADAKRTYGYYRLEILAALINGALLLAIAAGIAGQGHPPLPHPHPLQGRHRALLACLGRPPHAASIC